MKKLTNDEFILKANKIHGQFYNYDFTEYVRNRDKVNIVCPLHGEFFQTPNAHLNGQGCKICGDEKGINKRTLSHSKFLIKLKQKQPVLFSELKIIGNYTGMNNNILISDNFGLLRVTPYSLLSGCKPTILSAIDKTEYYVNKAKYIHNGFYSYEKTMYTSGNSKLIIKCPIHGEFEQIATSHIIGHGCVKCFNEDIRGKSSLLNTDLFCEMANEVHKFLYDYSKVNYTKSVDKVIIICKNHGEFTQTPASHLSGVGCPLCGYMHNLWSVDGWVEKSKKSFNFDTYTLYKVKCWNDSETFYKIGITFTSIEKRFSGNRTMPYEYEVLELIKSKDAEYIWKLEKELHMKHKKFKYIPKIEFGGMYECFDKII